MNTLKKTQNIVRILFLCIGVSFTTHAQRVGGFNGDRQDTWVVNTDRSNHRSQLRLQNDDEAFTFSNRESYMTLSHIGSFQGFNNQGSDFATFYSNGNTRFGSTFIGTVGHGNNWVGLSYYGKNTREGYSFLASQNGKHTLINKSNTGDGHIGFRIGNVDKMVLTNAGFLGIGTQTPQKQFHVEGDALVTGNTTFNGTAEITGVANFKNSVIMTKGINIEGDVVSNDTFYVKGALNFVNTDTPQQIAVNKGLNLRLTNTPGSHFSVQNALGVDAIYVDTKGKIAIGSVTSELTEQLHINGRVKASGFIADASSFPDYVFADDYNLMPLKEVKKHTEIYHSLPGMPTENEVITTGLDLKKVTTITVEKIEELYLHTIQQQELIEKQQDENDTLKNLILNLQKRLTILETQSSKK